MVANADADEEGEEEVVIFEGRSSPVSGIITGRLRYFFVDSCGRMLLEICRTQKRCGILSCLPTGYSD